MVLRRFAATPFFNPHAAESSSFSAWSISIVLFMSAILVREFASDIYLIGTQVRVRGNVDNQSIFGLEEDFTSCRPAISDVPRLLQLSRLVRLRTPCYVHLRCGPSAGTWLGIHRLSPSH